MNQVGKNRKWTSLSLVAIALLLVSGSADAGLFGLFGSKKKPKPLPTESLIVFPFDQEEGGARIPEEFGVDIASTLRSMLSGDAKYATYLYNQRLSPIRRAKEDSTLKTQDITPPFAEEREKAIRLADILAGDFLLVGSIDDYQVDTAKRQAQLTLTAELIRMVGREKGKLVKTFTVTGSVPESAKAIEEDELRALAAGDAVSKLKEEIAKTGEDKPEEVAE